VCCARPQGGASEEWLAAARTAFVDARLRRAACANRPQRCSRGRAASGVAARWRHARDDDGAAELGRSWGREHHDRERLTGAARQPRCAAGTDRACGAWLCSAGFAARGDDSRVLRRGGRVVSRGSPVAAPRPASFHAATARRFAVQHRRRSRDHHLCCSNGAGRRLDWC
jgi:hypothetical protein